MTHTHTTVFLRTLFSPNRSQYFNDDITILLWKVTKYDMTLVSFRELPAQYFYTVVITFFLDPGTLLVVAHTNEDIRIQQIHSFTKINVLPLTPQE